MTLHQEFSDAGRPAEIPVDLERGMRVKEIGITARTTLRRTQQHLDQPIRMITIEESRPEVDLPAQAPACGGISTVDE